MEKIERYKRSIKRCWGALQEKIRFLNVYLSGNEIGSETILDTIAGDFSLMLTRLSALGRGEAQREAKKLMELFQSGLALSTVNTSETQLQFLRLLCDALTDANDAPDWRYEAQETASDYLHILRYAAQSLETVSLYPWKVAECFNDYLRQTQGILCSAEIQVPLGNITVPAYRAADSYFTSAAAFLTGFEKRCQEMGMTLSSYELETIEDAIFSRFDHGNLMDSRFSEWLLTRIIRHQAERLYEDGGSPREITSKDIAAAWPDY